MIGIEIILGVVVLILAIIGIAKLASGRGGGGGGSANVDDVVKMASNAEKALANSLYNPEKFEESLKYMARVTEMSRGTIRALSQETRITRGKVDAAMEKYELPRQDKIEYLDALGEIYHVAGTAAAKYKNKIIDRERLLSEIGSELKAQREAFNRHYKLRHAGMD
jgi:hypothetical protein